MEATSAPCPKCRQTMEQGYVADIGHGIVIQSSWSPGEPEHRRFIGGIQWREGENIPIVTLRCPGAGFSSRTRRAPDENGV